MTKHLKTRFKIRPADTLIEVIIALFVVAVGSGAAAVLITTALQSNTFSKDNLIALNLAVEGIEAVRNVRDSNWIKYSYDKDLCWDMLPDPSSDDCSLVNNKLSDGFYTVDLDPDNYSWGTTNLGATDYLLDLSDGVDPKDEDYLLYFIDVTPGVDADGNGNDTDDRDMYVSETISTALGGDTGESRFYRMIQISNKTDEVMDVTCLVQWRGGASTHQIELNTSLTNFNR